MQRVTEVVGVISRRNRAMLIAFHAALAVSIVVATAAESGNAPEKPPIGWSPAPL